MKNRGQQRRFMGGFTIVELLIVVVVIAILAAITIVSYNGITSKARLSVLKSDLQLAATSLQLAAANGGDQFPVTLSGIARASQGVRLSLSQMSDSGYCINGELIEQSIRWYVSSSAGLQQGSCPGTVIPESEVGGGPNLVRDTGFTQINKTVAEGGEWLFRESNNTINGTTRIGTANDPYPGRPVLQYVVPQNPTLEWVYIRGSVDNTRIKAGKKYTMRYFIRIANGDYLGAQLYSLAVLDQNYDVAKISLSSVKLSSAVNGQWSENKRTTTALIDALPANVAYISIQTAPIINGPITVEIQGVEVYETS